MTGWPPTTPLSHPFDGMALSKSNTCPAPLTRIRAPDTWQVSWPMNRTDSSWRRAFADELIRLRPDLNPDVADELSDVAFPRHAGQTPNVAAQEFSRATESLPTGAMAGLVQPVR